jgi:hypothetical protein
MMMARVASVIHRSFGAAASANSSGWARITPVSASAEGFTASKGVVTVTTVWADERLYYPVHAVPYTPGPALREGQE